MKKLLLSITLFLPIIAFCQIPLGYYNTATGTGNTLKVALRNIIRPHTVLTYTPGLWNAYYTTDVKPNGKLWDMYSDIPGGTPAYEYTLGVDQNAGSSPTAEGVNYNREHTWPQSKFNYDTPMKNDLYIVIPTDYYVNGQRGNLPYGKVGSTVVHTFTNGSKIGNNIYAGAPSGNCFEPIDSFKGDFARTYFYIATCYYGADSNSFINWEMANGISLKPWAVQMLLDWHHNDPVSQKEINRNNEAYKIQVNRNPFIDHPEYADCIWGSGPCKLSVNDIENNDNKLIATTNPATNTLNISCGNATVAQFNSIAICNLTGQQVFTSLLAPGQTNLTISTNNWAKGMYIIRVNGAAHVEYRKVIVE